MHTKNIPLLALILLTGCPDEVDDTSDVDTSEGTDPEGTDIPDDQPREVEVTEDERITFTTNDLVFDEDLPFSIAAAQTDTPSVFGVRLGGQTTAVESDAVQCAAPAGQLASTCTSLVINDYRNPRPLVRGDVNGDGRDDILLLSSSGGEDGTGWINAHIVTGTSVGAGVRSDLTAVTNPSAPQVGDFDGDGNLDIAVASGEGDELFLFAGDGAGGFTQAATPTLGDSVVASFAFADLDGDGADDLVAATQAVGETTELWTWLGGSFTPGEPQMQVLNAPLGVGLLATGDLDDDGNQDVVSAGFVTVVYFGSGDGTFDPAPLHASGTLIQFPSILDLDGDGNLDVVGTSGSAVGVSVLYGDGAGSFAGLQDFSLDQSLRYDVDYLDFNDDGAMDIVSTGFTLGTEAVLQISLQD